MAKGGYRGRAASPRADRDGWPHLLVAAGMRSFSGGTAASSAECSPSEWGVIAHSISRARRSAGSRRRWASSCPFRLVLDPDPVRDSRDVVEVGDHLDRVGDVDVGRGRGHAAVRCPCRRSRRRGASVSPRSRRAHVPVVRGRPCGSRASHALRSRRLRPRHGGRRHAPPFSSGSSARPRRPSRGVRARGARARTRRT